MNLKPHIAYLKYLLRHKWYVFKACIRLGVPLYIAILHDWSKFLPSEWFPYYYHFYNQDGSKRVEQNASKEFTAAWRLHCKRNKHHWESWRIEDKLGRKLAFPMPEKYVREMVADWYGAGIAIHGKSDINHWYNENKADICLHTNTRNLVEELLQRFP